jgi:transcriptional regulator with XRE-family HTH domain
MITILSFRIKKLREKQKLSQAELAKSLNNSQRTISSWEQGIVEPSADKITAIANLFKVSTDYLLGTDYKTKVYIRLNKMEELNKQHIKDGNPMQEDYEYYEDKEIKNLIYEDTPEDLQEKEIQEEIMNEEEIKELHRLKQDNPIEYVELVTERARYKAAKEVDLLEVFYPNENEYETEEELNDHIEYIKAFSTMKLDKKTLLSIYDIDPT